MPAWPGGPCPECGDDVPEKMVHCPNCRALLNPDLEHDSVEIPEFIPLEEISAMSEVEATGYYATCPTCQQELRINRKYVGVRVQCKFCQAPFTLNNLSQQAHAFYAECPECHEELRSALKYMGHKVACKPCGAHIHFVQR